MTHSNPLPKDAAGGNIQSDVHLLDCMEGMARYEDNYFDLACVDPPYGIGYDGAKKPVGATEEEKPTFLKGGIVKYLIKNILMNYLEFLKIKLFGEQTI